MVANPIPTQFAMPKADIDAAIAQALREADEQGVKARSPPLPAGRVCEADRWQLPGGQYPAGAEQRRAGARIAASL